MSKPPVTTNSFYMPPPKLGRWEGFKLFLWNGQTKEFLGRTGTSWVKILIFYVCFYFGLACFFGLLMILFYQTLDITKPRWTLDGSLIGEHPGLGYRPMPPDKNSDSTLIWFKKGPNGEYKHWVDELDKFLKPYNVKNQKQDELVDCTDRDEKAKEGRLCSMDLQDFGPNCTFENSYGYERGTPCVAVKINKIYNWVPNVLDGSEDIPASIKQQIANNPAAKLVWLHCDGENPADKENIGDVAYEPYQGYSAAFFPYLNQKHYIQPVVMVEFLNPNPGVLINVECRIYAKNVDYNKVERKASVHFEIMVD